MTGFAKFYFKIMRPFSFGGFIVGLLVVSIGWGLLSLIMASVYNSLTKNTA
jgi:cell division protein FtsX